MKKFRYFLYIICIVVFSSPLIGVAQISTNSEKNNNTVISINDTSVVSTLLDSTITVADSLLVTDSIPENKIQTDSIASDTTKQKKEALDAPVDYTANDSIVFMMGNNGYLYGNAEIHYKEITLKAEKISMNMDSSIVHATYGIDSIGDEFGYPFISDNGSDLESKFMSYNFKTKKGFSKHSVTQQGEGFVVAEEAKKNDDDSYFLCNGKYTTCSDHDHPHFYLMITKGKMRPKKDIVFGPTYLVIEDLPLPLGLPFGFFPFTDKYSSGVIMPTYTDELERGFGLRDGGYYFAINDYVDLAVRGEIWTKGSWGLSAQSTYKKRYKYSGSVNTSFLKTIYGEKEDPDYRVSKDFRINWNHSQDPKANMYRTISANVDYSTSTYNRNNINQYYSGQNTTNTKSSAVTVTQRFPNSPFTLSGNINAAQRTSDSTVSLTLPNMTVNMSRIFPFKRKEKVGNEKWYEKIQFSYTGVIQNSITTKEDKLFNSSLVKDWKNGIKHTIPVSATFNLFNYLNITPSFTYTERWYTQKIYQKWDATQNRHISSDTISKFNRVFDFNYAISFQTKLYGFYQPLFKIGKIQTIRHVFTPSISFSGQPDFSSSSWGMYESYHYYDAYGELQEYTYSPYANGIFGTAPRGKQGNINFSFDNNLEMKVGAENDSTRIISLIDNLGIRFNYNMMADSLNWSDISTNIRLKLSKNLTVNLNATFDPYMYEVNKQGTGLVKVDKLRISKNGNFGRLMRTGYSISPSISNETIKKWFGKGTSKSKDEGENNSINVENQEDEENKEHKSLLSGSNKDENEYDDDGYIKNEIKWNLSFQYSFNYGYNTARPDLIKKEYKRSLSHNLGVSGSIQPTKNWSFNFSTSYDFDRKEFAQVNCALTRNLHCWSISASFVPIGPYKSYFVSLRASSSLLQDLKYEERGRSSSFDPEWY